ncbi:unnamed protein product [Linum trigynum]|uniref:Reverse transcriptase Ty1/copia-type domain-containing protein n=1 Tax=Linum trigynum TaxID=586398 RepID=A0AAV2C623_9ROSI
MSPPHSAESTSMTWLASMSPPVSFLPCRPRDSAPSMQPLSPVPRSGTPPSSSPSLDPSASTSTSTSASPSPSSSPPASSPAPAPCHPMTTRAKNNIVKPNKKYVNVVFSQDAPPLEPSSVKEAMRYDVWRNALHTEHNALLANYTWDLVPRLPHYNVIGSRWVYKVKWLPDGSIERHKCRLVAKGFHQRAGVDYHETFSPVLKPVTVRTVFTLALSSHWPIFQYDVNNAFLQGPLQEEVYMSQPPGFRDPKFPHHVCRLRRAIYGLRQAPRAWYEALSSFLLSCGFVKTASDASLFVYSHDGVLVYFLMYVDDLLLTGNNAAFLSAFQSKLSDRFSLKHLGHVHYFLGIEIIPNSAGFLLSQHKYVTDLLTRFQMHEAAPAPTPLASTARLTLADGSSPADATLYRQVLGALQYLVTTRPDIAFSVNKLSQYMHSPTSTHWQHVKRLLRYIAGTRTVGLQIRRQSLPLSLRIFSDSDWAGDVDDRTSTSGFLIYLGDTLLSWKSKK